MSSRNLDNICHGDRGKTVRPNYMEILMRKQSEMEIMNNEKDDDDEKTVGVEENDADDDDE